MGGGGQSACSVCHGREERGDDDRVGVGVILWREQVKDMAGRIFNEDMAGT